MSFRTKRIARGVSVPTSARFADLLVGVGIPMAVALNYEQTVDFVAPALSEPQGRTSNSPPKNES